jgi:hypothetical protein
VWRRVLQLPNLLYTATERNQAQDGVVKFNGQQDPQIWLDDFIAAVTISVGLEITPFKCYHYT